ncbi:MAG: LCP family protein, partial [bacterium]|nr:LCP family protein [bacterium]
GLPMHYYVMVDFTAFQKAIDTVGGITIDVKEPVSEQMLLNGKPYFLNVKTGSQNFDGLKALGYARCRHCDSRSDFGRSERQREIIIALKDKIFSGGTFSNPYKLQQLVSTFGNNVSTDIGTDEIGRLYEIGKGISGDRILSVSLVDEPNVLLTTDMISGQSVVVPKEGTFVYDDVRAFVRNRLKDSFLQKENARIAILNGTKTAGLAGKTTTELKSYGYNIVRAENAPTQDYVNTYVIDLTSGKMPYTQNYLEKRMQVTAQRQLTDAGIDTTDVDFVIIIGQNEANRQQN